MNINLVIWILRIAIFGEFLGHGVLGFQGKQAWINWIQQLSGLDAVTAAKILPIIGIMDILIAFIVLIKPIRAVLLWAALWGFWTALVRPLVGEPIWDFVERWVNWGAPLALLLLLGWPKNFKDWFKKS